MLLGVRRRTIPLLIALMSLAVAGGSARAAGPKADASGFDIGTPLVLTDMENAISQGDYPKTTSVLVIKDKHIVYERYFGKGTPKRLNDTRSATKTITAFAAGAALADGVISSIDDPVWPLFSDLGEQMGTDLTRAVTFRDLMTMTSAFDCDDNNDTPGNEENMYPEKSWTRFTWSLPEAPGWTRADDGLGPWRYCTAGVFLLGQSIQRAAATPIDAYIETRILAPLDIKRMHWDRSPSGEVQTGGGLELTTRDLGKLIWLIVDRGRWDGRQLLPARWIDAMTTPRRDTFQDMRYGYLTWTRTYHTPCGDVTAWFMAGNGGNHIVSIADKRVAIVVTRQAYNTRNMHQQTIDMLERYLIPAAVCGQ